MKRTTEPLPAANQEARRKNDDLCKFFAEEYPAQFAHWLFGTRGKVKVEKTELSRDPIRADAVIFSTFTFPCVPNNQCANCAGYSSAKSLHRVSFWLRAVWSAAGGGSVVRFIPRSLADLSATDNRRPTSQLIRIHPCNS